MKQYSHQGLGLVMAVLSAFIFGFTPIFAQISFAYGVSPVSLTFLRALLALPMLGFLVKRSKQSFHLTVQQVRDLILIGAFGTAATTLLIYSAYAYIGVGMATTIHFLYPVTIVLAEIFLFHDKITSRKSIALLLCFMGVITLMSRSGDLSIKGVLMAALSSLTYTVYLIGIERSSLRQIHHYKLTFYICLVSSASVGLFGIVSGTLQLQIEPVGWMLSIIVSMLVSVIALTLLQQAITYVGASTTAILSNMEPITSVLLGVFLLHEAMERNQAIGCFLILIGVLFCTLPSKKQFLSKCPKNED